MVFNRGFERLFLRFKKKNPGDGLAWETATLDK